MKELKKTIRVMQKIGNWIIDGDTGLSSKALLGIYLGSTSNNLNYPVDPSDFRRCIYFLEKVLDADDVYPLLYQMAQRNENWEKIRGHWETLRRIWLKECKNEKAPELYAYMKKIGL